MLRNLIRPAAAYVCTADKDNLVYLKTGIERENSTEIMFEIQTSDYLDWLANGVNHSHPDYGGPGCYTFRSSRQWVRQNNIYRLSQNEVW